jgi:hypothetical protein
MTHLRQRADRAYERASPSCDHKTAARPDGLVARPRSRSGRPRHRLAKGRRVLDLEEALMPIKVVVEFQAKPGEEPS